MSDRGNRGRDCLFNHMFIDRKNLYGRSPDEVRAILESESDEVDCFIITDAYTPYTKKTCSTLTAGHTMRRSIPQMAQKDRRYLNSGSLQTKSANCTSQTV